MGSYVPFAKILGKNVRETSRAIKKVDSDRRKAAFTAARVEAFRLRKDLGKDLNRGVIAGMPLEPLSEIAKLLRDRRKTPGIKPLKPLSKHVKYRVDKTGSGEVIDIGFVNPGGSGAALSGSWKRIAVFQHIGDIG